MPDRRDDFDHRLADRLAAYEAGLPSREAPAPGTRPPRGRWPAVLAVAGAAVAAGAVLGAVVLGMPRMDVAQSSATPTPTAPAAPATPQPSPTVTPSPSAPATPSESPAATSTPTVTPGPTPLPSGPATIAWATGDRLDGVAYTVTRHRDRWIAAGAIRVGDADRPAAWASADGLSWHGPALLPPEPVPDADGFMPRYLVTAFGEWGEGLLAVGWNGIGCCDGGRPMLWRSDDGVTWSVVDTAGSAFGEGWHFPTSAFTTPAGELGVLSSTLLGAGGSIFMTRDLATWTEHPITAPDEFVDVTGIAASSETWIAVGTHTPSWEAEEGPRPEPRVWSSTDGQSWSPTEPPSGGGSLDGIAWDPARARFVAVGSDGNGHPVAWLTLDGRSWSRIPLDDEEGRVDDIAIADGLIVAAGILGPMFESSGETIAWSSRDGVTWRVVPMSERHGRTVAGATAGSAVLIVNRHEDDRNLWEAWAGPIGE